MENQGSTRRYTFRARLVFAGFVALLALAPAADGAEVSSLPAAGGLNWPSVAARTRPDPGARTVRLLYQFRNDFRRQIVLAIAKKRVGVVEATKATATLTDVASTSALKLAARSAGTEGNGLGVLVRDRPTAEGEPAMDELVVGKNGVVVETFAFPDGNVAQLAAAINAGSQLVAAAAVSPTAQLVRDTAVALSGGRNENPGRLWYRLNLPIRPFGTTGWVPAESVRVRPTTKKVVVHRRARLLVVYRNGRRIFRTRVAIGRAGRPTPLGNFYVAAKFRPPRTTLVSTYALELSAPAGLSDFPGGGVVGIHGTPAAWSIGRAASNGCVRVLPAAALRLKRLVPLGTPVRVAR